MGHWVPAPTPCSARPLEASTIPFPFLPTSRRCRLSSAHRSLVLVREATRSSSRWTANRRRCRIDEACGSNAKHAAGNAGSVCWPCPDGTTEPARMVPSSTSLIRRPRSRWPRNRGWSVATASGWSGQGAASARPRGCSSVQFVSNWWIHGLLEPSWRPRSARLVPAASLAVRLVAAVTRSRRSNCSGSRPTSQIR